MIKTDRQLRHTEKEIARFAAAVDDLAEGASRDAALNVLQEMCEDVADYEALKRGDLSRARSTSPYGLPEVIIRTRIARGMSQSDLAQKLGVKPQQVQRWEADEYESINAGRLFEIADILGIRTYATASDSFITSNVLPFTNTLSFSSRVFAWNGMVLTGPKAADLSSGCGAISARIHHSYPAPVIHVDDSRGVVGGAYIRVATAQQPTAVNTDQLAGQELRFA